MSKEAYGRYNEIQEKINFQLGTITDQLAAHVPVPAALTVWSHVGDLNHVSDCLNDVIVFMSPGE